MKDRSSKATKLEVVYHWTGEENVQKIVETWLRLGPIFTLGRDLCTTELNLNAFCRSN